MEKKPNKPTPGTPATQADFMKSKTALDKLAARLDLTPSMLTSTLKATAFSLCKDDAQFVAAVVVANTYGLNPLLKEMTAFPGKAGGVIPVVMIDGWIKLVNRQGDYNGVELIENKHPEGKINKSGTDVDSVTAKFYLKDREHPVVVTEYMEECFDGTKDPWKRWPRRMLRHKAYIQGARVAFGFSGIYDEDEKDRIIAAEATVLPAEPVIGLKTADQTAAPGAGTATSEQAAGPEGQAQAEVVEEWNSVGDLARFGPAKESKAKFMAQNIETCARKMGKENFMNFLGTQGITSLQEVLKFEDLVKLANLLLEEAKK